MICIRCVAWHRLPSTRHQALDVRVPGLYLGDSVLGRLGLSYGQALCIMYHLDRTV